MGSDFYFKRVGKHSLLSREQEVVLAKLIESGDDAARAKMIEHNLRLAISIAKKYQNRGCPFEDLVQESNIGLMKAVSRFDWRRGFKFSTYASWWIRQSVGRHVSLHSRTIRVPSHATNLMYKINLLIKEYRNEFNCDPTMAEIGEVLGLTAAEINEALRAVKPTVSLDIPVSTGDSGMGRFLHEIIADDNASDLSAEIDSQTVLTAVKSALSLLTAREEKILRLRFGIYYTDKNDIDFHMTDDEINALNVRMLGKQ